MQSARNISVDRKCRSAFFINIKNLKPRKLCKRTFVIVAFVIIGIDSGKMIGSGIRHIENAILNKCNLSAFRTFRILQVAVSDAKIQCVSEEQIIFFEDQVAYRSFEFDQM